MIDASMDFAASANGDRWALVRDADTGLVQVLHSANPPSGGAVTQIEIRDFLSPFVGSPEQLSLVVMIGSLAMDAPTHDHVRAGDIEKLREADESDVKRALDGASIALPITTTHEALELFHCVLDVMTDQREIDEAADHTRIAAGFGSTH